MVQSPPTSLTGDIGKRNIKHVFAPIEQSGAALPFTIMLLLNKSKRTNFASCF